MNMIFDQDPSYASAVKEYFDQRTTNLCELYKNSKQSNDKFHFEILLLSCCYIDALASIFTDEKEVGKRFMDLLISVGETNGIDFSKINLIFLRHQFWKPVEKMTFLPQKYNKWISKEIEKRDYSVGDNTTHDFAEDKILESLLVLSTEEEKKTYGDILQERIRKSSYAGVLYANYRNPAVHEAQVRGHWSTGSENKPFYMNIIDSAPELSFPPLFLIEVVSNILSRIYVKCEDVFLKSEIGE